MLSSLLSCCVANSGGFHRSAYLPCAWENSSNLIDTLQPVAGLPNTRGRVPMHP